LLIQHNYKIPVVCWYIVGDGSTIGKTVSQLICNMLFCSLCTTLMLLALDYSPKLLILRVFVEHSRHMSISRWSAINKNFVQTPILDYFLSESVLHSFFETVAYTTKLLDPCSLLVYSWYMSISKWSTIGKTLFLLIFGRLFLFTVYCINAFISWLFTKILILRVWCYTVSTCQLVDDQQLIKILYRRLYLIFSFRSLYYVHPLKLLLI
jgi:hypothetical protein